MKFVINNLGRLQEAKIDIGKGLTIFCGKNNTSKTYAAHAIYGFCVHIFFALYKSILRNYIQFNSSIHLVKIDLEAVLRKDLRNILKDISAVYTEELPDVFATNELFIGSARINIEITEEEEERSIQKFMAHSTSIEDLELGNNPVTMIKEKNSGIVSFVKSPNPEALFNKVEEVSLAAIEDKEFVNGIFFGLTWLVYKFMFKDFGTVSHVLSAERSAIQLFSHELSLRRNEMVEQMLKLQSIRSRPQKNKERAPDGSLIDVKNPLDILQKRARRYPLPIQESLKIADDLVNLSKKETEFADLADWAESSLLQGSIRINEDGEMRFHPTDTDKQLEMHLASSSVKALSGLVFYLRHLITGDCLTIIDEPELNLHPDNQRLVARLLARMVNSGINVLISTHSEYIIRELNNLIMFNKDTDGTKREQFGYEKADVLSKELVRAYLFTGTTAVPIEITDTGIEVKTIDEELNKLNTVSQELYYSFFAPKTTEA